MLEVVEEISRFNDHALGLMESATFFENIGNFLNIKSADHVKKLCNYFADIDVEPLWADIKSFQFFLQSVMKSTESGCSDTDPVLPKVLEVKIGYENLQKICKSVMCMAISTVSVERSFSTMNRVLIKLRSRMGEKTGKPVV